MNCRPRKDDRPRTTGYAPQDSEQTRRSSALGSVSPRPSPVSSVPPRRGSVPSVPPRAAQVPSVPPTPAPEGAYVVARTSLGTLRQLPRNAKKGYEGPQSDRWGMTTTPTPPPVAVYSESESPTPAPIPKAARRSRIRAAMLGMLSLLVVLVVARSATRDPRVDLRALRALSPLLPVPVEPAQSASQLLPVEPPPSVRADAKLRRDGYSTIRGGVLYIPETFSSKDGDYDLLIHFHGNVKVIVESAEVAQVNALVAVVNLGVGSAVYENAYAAPGTYEALLSQIHHAISERGLQSPALRRVGLSSWSAGYGAISTILQVRRKTDPLDAILLSDGLHCGRLPERPSMLNHRQLAPFVDAAKKAATGDMLFAISHSDIDPVTYVGSGETATYLLDAVKKHAAWTESSPVAPAHLQLKAAINAVEPSLEKKMEPTRDVRAGDLHVRGFRGQTKEHHSAHLLQIGATLFPELSERWASR